MCAVASNGSIHTRGNQGMPDIWRVPEHEWPIWDAPMEIPDDSPTHQPRWFAEI